MSRSALIVVVVLGVLSASSGSAFAAHVSCGDVITKNTKLDSDLIDCTGAAGIEIGADNITLDLDGHVIDGNYMPPQWRALQIGVRNNGHVGVKIKDGTIREAQVGVELTDARRNTLKNLTVVYEQTGFGTNPEMVQLLRSHENRIIDTAMPSGVFSLRLQQSNDNVISDSLAIRITIDPGDRNVVRRSSMLALTVITGNQNLIRGNAVGNGIGGIGVTGVQNRIVANAVTHVVGGGIAAIGGGNAIERNFVQDVTFTGILVGNRVDIPAGPADVVRNVVVGAGTDGIEVRSPGSLVRGNEANANGQLGIRAVPGVIDGGRNRAAGNGDPLQCLNVFCR